MRLIVIFIFIVCSTSATAQEVKPKLVIGIIVDQMRQDYLLRYGNRFVEGGFNRFINEGFSFNNIHYNYIPTKTAPGHATVYTGATPYLHGIIGNHWYSRDSSRVFYCVEDQKVETVGTSTVHGKMSPANLKTTTITDELRLTNQFRSKVISLSIKDRGAILPAGNSGLAIWMDKSEGQFITSSYYQKTLPDWVEKFNQKGLADEYMKSTWNTLYAIDSYRASGPDKEAGERTLDGRMSGFPYDLSKLNDDYGNIIKTPFGNEILTKLALDAIERTDLGEDEDTDFLAISYSSTDYIGHDSGPYSIEVEDAYLRLDQNLAKLFKALDKKLGKENYTIFLTADHGVAPIPQYLLDRKFRSGYFEKSKMLEELKSLVNKHFTQDSLIEHEINNNIYLDHDKIRKANLDLQELRTFVSDYLLTFHGIAESYTVDQISLFSQSDSGIKGMLARGYNSKSSGDVVYVTDPTLLVYWKGDATNHGSGYTYDTHIPLLWYGAGIRKGKTYKYGSITQIVPTLSMMLGISLPNAAFDEPLYELLPTK